MTSERDPGYPEVARRLREELARIRTSEAQVEQALEAVRSARRRVEELALSLEGEEKRVRALVRDEIRAAGAATAPVAGPIVTTPPPTTRKAGGPADLPWRRGRESEWPAETAAAADAATARLAGHRAPPLEARADRPAPVARDVGAPPDGEKPREGRRLAVVALVALLAVGAVGWLALQGMRGGIAVPGPVVISGNESPAGQATPEESEPSAARPDDPPPDPATPPAGATLASLPSTPAAQLQLFDSLFQARSPAFTPMIDSIGVVTRDRDVNRAVRAWRAGSSLSTKQRDLIQSAFVQWILLREIDQRVQVDGELLRNPCRGTSCSALLNLWQVGQARYGFPDVPDDAPRNAQALRTVEAMMVLRKMREIEGGGAG